MTTCQLLSCLTRALPGLLQAQPELPKPPTAPCRYAKVGSGGAWRSPAHSSGVRCMCEDRWWWLGSWQVVMATGSRDRYLELEAERTWELWRELVMMRNLNV